MAKAGKRSTTSRSRTQQKRWKPSAPPAQREPIIIGPDEKIYLRPSRDTERFLEGIRFAEQMRQRKPRRKPKSDLAREIFLRRFPPDGMPPSRKVPDSELERIYHEECDRMDVSKNKNARASHTQLLRVAGRKKH
jgi:hypothetical protein